MAAKNFLVLRGAFSNASIQHKLKYLFAAGLIALVFYLAVLNQLDNVFGIELPHSFTSTKPPAEDNHPIRGLAKEAEAHFEQLLAKRSVTLEQAASRYRERRGRHPPPGFDTWFLAAQNRSAIIVEEFFDRIHHDLNPFWAFDPTILRRMIKDDPHYIRVRDGKAWFVSEHIELRQPWVQLWTKLVQEMMPNLPDLDMVLNVMDETRLLVPWEDINQYVAEEQRQRAIFNASEAVQEYTKYPDENATDTEPAIKVEWIDDAHHFWDHYRVACPPNSPGRNVSNLETLARPPSYPSRPLPFTAGGFIKNFTAAMDPCEQPHIRGMHGTFIESVSMATSHSLIPMFAGSKLPRNNEILIPAGMILDDYELFSGGDSHGGAWSLKKNELVWRGVASGGRHKEDNWWGFHRHRFIQMMNGTTVSRLEAGEDVAPTFNLSNARRYHAVAQRNKGLGSWLSSFSDVAFVNLECFPHHDDNSCPHMDPYMKIRESIPMKDQYEYKYLPDVDGNSYSGRFRAFMRSTSLVLKSTIYAEWHDDRLIPWVHFVPFDTTYADIYAILDYYLNGHDREAQKIAEAGHEWAEKVMRREDMLLYVWRLLLEYARVVDPSRDRLGFVDDLKSPR